MDHLSMKRVDPNKAWYTNLDSKTMSGFHHTWFVIPCKVISVLNAQTDDKWSDDDEESTERSGKLCQSRGQ